MATLKQKRAVKKILENPEMPISRVMALPEVGYSLATATNPKDLTESKGFKEALAENGLTEAFITKALVSDINEKPRKRFFELNLGAEILGMKKRDPAQTNVLIVNVTPNGARKYGIKPSASDNL